MMHPDDIKRLAIMGTLIMLCAFCLPGAARASRNLDTSVMLTLG